MKKGLTWLLTLALALSLAACGAAEKSETPAPAEETAAQEQTEKNGEVMILYTGDVHCGVDQGFGYAGLRQIRDTLTAQGFETILVDVGDAVQGELLGTLTKGEAVIDLMNAMGYDLAIPGNHEFDFGADNFLKLTEKARFPYLSCNIFREGEPLFAPYCVKEAAGKKIAFVGVTTPTTPVTSTPAFFQNEAGEFLYDFLRDDSGERLYSAVQKAVDDARAEGAELVYLLAHLGMGAAADRWTYADVIEHTSGIDVVVDSHSHDTDQVVMKNKNGESVVRTASGTKLEGIGYSRVSAEGEIVETNIWRWSNETSAPELLNLQNDMREKTDAAMADLQAILDAPVARSAVTLTINDPEAVSDSGAPIRIIRRAETNLGDFCADAVRAAAGAEIGMVNGGGIRTSLAEGTVTYGDVVNVFPFNNQICAIRATGQQILDALEWGAHAAPNQFGGFLQVSGMTYEIDVSVPDPCTTDENGFFSGVSGARRVKNATVGGEPLDPSRTYVVAGTDYVLLGHGDGHAAFDGAEVLRECVKLDNQALIDYVADTLGGEIGAQYAEPYGEGRITLVGG
ncbi:MAG: bifunctional metallophosphatase/5'-nucleotidase [Oscillibacter sp.]|nr:bifunctional metallophosphatase/5'-nucleotidase [Oscillibacter sp.]